jgi:hypothetical protein
VEREIARVAAACDLYAFRYIPFVPIKFDLLHIVTTSEYIVAPMAESVMVSPALAQPTTPIPAPVGDLTSIIVAPMAASTPVPSATPPAIATVPPRSPPPSLRDYRMLHDLALNQHTLPMPVELVAPEATPFATRRPTIRRAMPAVRATHPGPQPAGPQVSAVPPRGMTGASHGTPRRAWPRERQQT